MYSKISKWLSKISKNVFERFFKQKTKDFPDVLGQETNDYQQKICTDEGAAGDNDKNGGGGGDGNCEKIATFLVDSFLPKETILMPNLLN